MLYLFVGLVELITLVISHYYQDAIYFMLGQLLVIAIMLIPKIHVKIINLIITSVLGVYVYSGMDISVIYVACGTLVGLCTLLCINLSNDNKEGYVIHVLQQVLPGEFTYNIHKPLFGDKTITIDIHKDKYTALLCIDEQNKDITNTQLFFQEVTFA